MTRAGAGLLLLLLLAPACASFDPLDFGGERPPPVVTTPAHTLPTRERIRYSGTWNGIPAGRGRLELMEVDGVLRSRARIETSGLVALIYGVGVDAGATTRAGDGSSIGWWYETDGGDPEKEIHARFDPVTGEIVAVVRQGEGEEPKVRELTAPEAQGPFATIYALRRAALEPGTEFRADVFTEWWIYRVDARVTGRETVKVPAGEFEALVVRVDVRKVEDGVPDDETHGAAIWLTDDRDRTPVRIEADTNYGRVALSMLSRTSGWPEIPHGRGTRVR